MVSPEMDCLAAARAASWAGSVSESHITELNKRATEAEAKLKRLYEAIENGLINMADLSLKDRIAELTAIRDQAQADAARASGCGDDWPESYRREPEALLRGRPRQATHQDRRISPRSPSSAGSTRRGGQQVGDSAHGKQIGSAAHACCRIKRRSGGERCSQFCTEVARPKRFELLTPRFVVWCSIQLSYGRPASCR